MIRESHGNFWNWKFSFTVPLNIDVEKWWYSRAGGRFYKKRDNRVSMHSNDILVEKKEFQTKRHNAQCIRWCAAFKLRKWLKYKETNFPFAEFDRLFAYRIVPKTIRSNNNSIANLLKVNLIPTRSVALKNRWSRFTFRHLVNEITK